MRKFSELPKKLQDSLLDRLAETLGNQSFKCNGERQIFVGGWLADRGIENNMHQVFAERSHP